MLVQLNERPVQYEDFFPIIAGYFHRRRLGKTRVVEYCAQELGGRDGSVELSCLF